MKLILKDRIYKSKFYMQAIKVFALMVTILLVSILIIYSVVRGRYVDSIIEENHFEFESRIEKMDDIFKNIMHSTERITNNNLFSELVIMNHMDEQANYIMKKLSKDIAYDELNIPIDTETFIYFADYEKIVYSGGVMDVEMFSHYLERYDTDDYKQWSEKYLNKRFFHKMMPSAEVEYMGDKTERIMYIHSYPRDVGKPKATVVKLISTKSIQEILCPLEDTNKCSISVINKNEEIFSLGTKLKLEETKSGVSQKRIAGKKHIVFSTESKLNKWKYVQAVPQKTMQKYLLVTDLQTMLLAFVCILGIFLLFFIFVNEKANVFKKIIDKLGAENTNNSVDELSVIGDAIDSILVNNAYLENNLKKNRHYLKENFLFQLINGYYKSMSSVENAISDYGLDINMDATYIVLAFCVDTVKFTNEELNLDNVELIEKITKAALRLKCKCNLLEYANDILVILQIDSNLKNNGGEIEKYAENIINMVCEENDNTYVFVGLPHSGVMGIYYSYNDICVAKMNIKKDWKEKVFYSREPQKNVSNYYYPLKFEEMMINMVSVGNSTEIQQLIDRIYTENFVLNNINSVMFNLLKNQIFSTLLKIFNECFNGDEQQMKNFVEFNYEIIDINDEKQFFKEVKELLVTLCELCSDVEERKQNKLKNRIFDYIEKNYCDMNLSLSKIAEDFNYSEAYFSKTFKKLFGITYASYVENLRIETSLKLLSNPNYSIIDVAKKVGYVNAQVYRKAFKRCKGILPSEYKKK